MADKSCEVVENIDSGKNLTKNQIEYILNNPEDENVKNYNKKLIQITEVEEGISFGGVPNFYASEPRAQYNVIEDKKRLLKDELITLESDLKKLKTNIPDNNYSVYKIKFPEGDPRSDINFLEKQKHNTALIDVEHRKALEKIIDILKEKQKIKDETIESCDEIKNEVVKNK